MNRREVEELIKTIDIMKIIGSKIKEEARIFSNYIIGFGTYISINSILSAFSFYSGWFYMLTFAYFISHSLNLGLIRALLIWAPLSILAYLPSFLIKNYTISFISLAVSIFLGFYFWSRLSKFEARPNLIARIGMVWAFAYFGLFYLIVFYPKIAEYVTILNLFLLSILFFISSVISYMFLALSGIIMFLGIPLVALNKQLVYVLYTLIGIFMVLFGIFNRR